METDRLLEGELWVQDGKIVYVGDGSDGKSVCEDMDGQAVRWDREIDCERNLLMPGFKDAHTHSGMTLLRSYADDLPLQDWLFQQIFPIEAKMDGGFVIGCFHG